jgi:hypothetical protein
VARKKGGVLILDAPLFYKCENQYLISQTVSCEVVKKYPQYIVLEALWTEVMYTAEPVEKGQLVNCRYIHPYKNQQLTVHRKDQNSHI